MKSLPSISRFGIPLAAIVILCFLLVPAVSADDTYVIQWGDNLYRIALKFGLTTQQLAQANNIYNPDHIYAGQVLVIPGVDADNDPEQETETSPDAEAAPASNSESDVSSASTEEPAEAEYSSTTYIVKRGDTLSRIATRFGISTQLLVQYNEIWNPSFIYGGQILTIPDPNDPGVIDESSLPLAPYSYGERWIDVNLTTQRMTAYEERQPVYSTAISSGLWPHITVTGLFKIYLRYQSQTMNGYRLGYDYYLTNVPYVMYFYRDYAIHGTYWHNNFGNPMSHGCVNTPTPDAQWLYNWSDYGTPVNVHY